MLTALGNPQADCRALHRSFGQCKINTGLAALGQPRFGPLAGIFGALDVDFLDALGRVCQHQDAVVGHFQEAAEDNQRLFLTSLLDTHLAG